jgi:hypothetical protein
MRKFCFYCLTLIFLPGIASAQLDLEGPQGWLALNSKEGSRGWFLPSTKSILMQLTYPDQTGSNLDQLTLKAAQSIGQMCPARIDPALIKRINTNERHLEFGNDEINCLLLLKRSNALLIVLVAVDPGRANVSAQNAAQKRMASLNNETLARLTPQEPAVPNSAASANSKPNLIARPFVAAFFETRSNSNGGTSVVTSVGADGNIMSSIIPSWTISAQDNIHILFSDGTACWNCLDDYYVDARLTKLRRENPNDMGQWKKIGSNYQITYPDNKKEPLRFASSESLEVATVGQRYDVKLSTNTGFTTGSLTLRRDGSFSIAPEAKLEPDGPRGSNGKSDDFGTYQVLGATIVFRFANRKVDEFSLLASPKSPLTLYIDRSSYYKEKTK